MLPAYFFYSFNMSYLCLINSKTTLDEKYTQLLYYRSY
ncbi:hypothetical protein EZS27_006177 [termite gut metagenome]|uniref:Uncharacterized protein n=1 Tax=termite gut metagenome TaxID=433724 RepID=A0A5J4SJK3_9ZZZZ